MIDVNKLLIKLLADLEESSPNFRKSVKEISPLEFCINIKGHKNIYIKIDDKNSEISFLRNNPQFEIRGSLIELLNTLVSKKLNKNLVFGNSELAIVFVNIILKSNIDIIYLIDKYFGNTSAVFAYGILKLFKSADDDSDVEYENIRRRLREISIKLDRLEAIKGI
tara:strand:- start:2903 stop:3400 length:498 start_codon:yes stop_codon:yes gene_type:complete